MGHDTEPIACILDPQRLQERLTVIRSLARHALLESSRDGLTLRLRYARNAAAAVRRMVLLERGCCAFLRFSVEERDDGVEVTIAAPEQAREAADPLFEAFTAGVVIPASRS